MHPVLFYGVPQGCSFGSIVALEWLQQPYQLCRIDMLEYPWDRLFGRLNPLYQTPALLTADNRPLSESLAILLHLASHAEGSPLGPRQGTPSFDRLNQWLAYLVTDFFSAFAPLWITYEKDDLSDAQRAVLRE
ncbi:MAG TPA: glutathione S-transferase N-terminal domain-containing protein, partial [Pseudomonas sp.]|nr:glutathione S-transferase N-terminal domain-containing protein [Pseudomonas sp.]